MTICSFHKPAAYQRKPAQELTKALNSNTWYLLEPKPLVRTDFFPFESASVNCARIDGLFEAPDFLESFCLLFDPCTNANLRKSADFFAPASSSSSLLPPIPASPLQAELSYYNVGQNTSIQAQACADLDCWSSAQKGNVTQTVFQNRGQQGSAQLNQEVHYAQSKAR